MNTRLITAPAIEPLTLLETKSHLRLDSTTFAGSLEQYQSIVPGSHVIAASYSLKGSGVDVLGKEALVRLSAGTCGASGTVDVKIQEADTDSDEEYVDWTGGAFDQVSETNDNQVFEKEYTGTKQYIRVVATVAVAACEFAVSVEVRAATIVDDTLVTNLIKVARDYAESFTNRALITQTWELYLDEWPEDERYIRIPYPELLSVEHIKYKDSANNEVDWATSNYIQDKKSLVGRVVLGFNKSWPSVTLYPSTPITVQFKAGYGATRADVPERIRQAMLVYIETLYEHRGELITGTTVSGIPAPFTVDSLLWPFRVDLI